MLHGVYKKATTSAHSGIQRILWLSQQSSCLDNAFVSLHLRIPPRVLHFSALVTGVVIAVMGVIVGSSGFLFALTRSRRLVLIIQLCSEGIHAVG